MLKTCVKASRVTNLTDARYFAAWEVNWIGFPLDPASEFYVNPKDLVAMRDWLTGPKIVGEFGMQDLDSILETTALLKLDAIQLSGFREVDELKGYNGPPVIKEMVIDQQTSPDMVSRHCADWAPFCEVLMLDFSKNGGSWQALRSGHNFDLSHLKRLCRQYPILLSIDCSPDEMEVMLNELQPHGLNLFGGEEEKTGIKSFDEIDELFELLYHEG